MTWALSQLDIGSYKCGTFPYKSRALLDAEGLPPSYPSLEDWVQIFYASIASFQRTAESDAPTTDSEARAAEFAENYRRILDQLMAEVKSDPLASWEHKINCLELCRLREQALKDAGFKDIYRSIKQEENMKALDLLPEVLAEIDEEVDLHKRYELIFRGVCAANIFDLGAAHTTDMYHKNGGVSFHDAREKLLPRPWVIDDMDRIVNRLATGPPYMKALLFVDNSGADVFLGMFPLARELVRSGTTVVIAANEGPSINDITYAELEILLPRVSSADDVLCKAIATQRLMVVSSGNELPVIDLTGVSKEVVDAAGDADLVILEGMGRSIETNLMARLQCDCIKVGMVKHNEVAACLGGRLLDCVLKYDQP